MHVNRIHEYSVHVIAPSCECVCHWQNCHYQLFNTNWSHQLISFTRIKRSHGVTRNVNQPWTVVYRCTTVRQN